MFLSKCLMNKDLSDFIRTEARTLGFDKIGIARAEALDREAPRLAEWLSRGYHGTMDWMAGNGEKRLDPGKIVPGARSVVSVAMNYYVDGRHGAGSAKISRYAWGDDYHGVLLPRLKLLLESIKRKEPAASGKVYVDTGPVLEKVWAQKAGVGWEGKHTNVITQEYGSWVFLGELILDVELEYDGPATDHCGSCTLCIEACPTGAIVAPYVLDSTLCISYLTIEHRGEIAPELGEKFGGWIYGCDICQDVCPWNQKFSEPTDVKEFSPREGNLSPRLEELAQMSEEEFAEKFRKSPIRRTKRSGLARNARVALSTIDMKHESP